LTRVILRLDRAITTRTLRPSSISNHTPDGTDLNGFLKWEQLGRSLNQTGCLQAQLHFQKQFMGMSQRQSGARTAPEVISDHLSQAASVRLV
jgi:hypothetical protein